MAEPKILTAGDAALTVEFGDEISGEINAKVQALDAAVQEAGIRGVVETVPTYRSLLVCYDPLTVRFSAIRRKIARLLRNLSAAASSGGRIVEIPVCYGGEYGQDLSDVAAHAGLSEDEVVRIHSSRDYLIYMLGFLPGFPYLGGLDPRIATPRLSTPRVRIPAGAVAIGGEQTGIYPIASPGGWRLIGNTPLRLYDPERGDPILYRAGDRIRFVPISKGEYLRIEALAQKGEYRCKIREGGGADGN